MQPEGQQLKLLKIDLGHMTYAIPLLEAREIRKKGYTSELPKTHNYVSGVTNIRGQMGIVINLKKRLGVQSESQHSEDRACFILVERHQRLYCLEVDHVESVFRIDQSKIQTDLNPNGEDFIHGAIENEDNRFLMILDIPGLLDQTPVFPGDKPTEKAA